MSSIITCHSPWGFEFFYMYVIHEPACGVYSIVCDWFTDRVLIICNYIRLTFTKEKKQDFSIVFVINQSLIYGRGLEVGVGMVEGEGVWEIVTWDEGHEEWLQIHLWRQSYAVSLTLHVSTIYTTKANKTFAMFWDHFLEKYVIEFWKNSILPYYFITKGKGKQRERNSNTHTEPVHTVDKLGESFSKIHPIIVSTENLFLIIFDKSDLMSMRKTEYCNPNDHLDPLSSTNFTGSNENDMVC